MSHRAWMFIASVFAGALCCVSAGIWLHFRRKIVRLSEEICGMVDAIIAGKEKEQTEWYEDTLLSKVQSKLEQLEEVVKASEEKNICQKEEIQKTVSDISHQLKTPIANIVMYHEMFMRQGIPEKQREQFLAVMKNQVEKLDFLIQSLMKMSRLENGMIQIQKERNHVYDVIMEVVENLSLKLEKKQIDLQIDCPEELVLEFDRKWTTEAIFNVMDNAVKYTPEGGTIQIQTEMLGIFCKIVIRDSGIGIAPEHMTDIFKRFYREDKVHGEEGAGLGLYLTREILTQQGGYVKVDSKEGKGSTFSLYFLA